MSTGFLIICLALLALVILGIAAPFWRKPEGDTPSDIHQSDQDQEATDLAVEREVLSQSLQELDDELAQGRLEPDDYERLKATDERRLLDVLNRIQTLAIQPHPQTRETVFSAPSRPWINIIIPSVLVVVMSIGIYGYMQWVNLQKIIALRTETGTNAPDPRKMVAQLEERLRENPDDLQGQVMAGRSYIALQRIDDARKAWTKVLELDPRHHEANFRLGVIMIETRTFDDPELFTQALAHFDTVLVDRPNQPGVNWYRGLTLWYLKRHRETEEAWATAFKNLDPASQDAEFVKAALAKLRNGETPF